MGLFNFLFGSKHVSMDEDILFNTECSEYGSHGTILASHRDKRIDKKEIRFVFKCMAKPPALTPKIIEYIFIKAKEKGYYPYELLRYDTVNSNTIKLEDSLKINYQFDNIYINNLSYIPRISTNANSITRYFNLGSE